MISYFQVKEQSMEPWARQGDFVVAERVSYLFSKPKVGQIVVTQHPQKPGILLLKRIVKEKEGRYWLEGDNGKMSTDSRHFGWVRQKSIVGKAYIVGKPRTKSALRRIGTGLSFA